MDDSLVAQLVKNPPAMQETPVRFLLWEDPLEKIQDTHSSILGLPWWLRWYRICLQCGKPGFNPWVGKIPWRRAWQPTPVFLPGESPWTQESSGLQSMGSQRVKHDWATKHNDKMTRLKFSLKPSPNQCLICAYSCLYEPITLRLNWDLSPISFT